MEDTLGDLVFDMIVEVQWGLNPCFNGRYSRRLLQAFNSLKLVCLNPYSNGRYSRRDWVSVDIKTYKMS